VFRIELDALNGIHKQLIKQNELLEQLLELKKTEHDSPIEHKPKRQYTRKVNENAG